MAGTRSAWKPSTATGKPRRRRRRDGSRSASNARVDRFHGFRNSEEPSTRGVRHMSAPRWTNRNHLILGAFAALMALGTATPVHAENYTFLKCDMKQLETSRDGEPTKVREISETWYFAFDEQGQKFLESTGNTPIWYLPGTECRTSIAPAAIEVSCSLSSSTEREVRLRARISRTSGDIVYSKYILGSRMFSVTSSGTCAPLPSDPLLPSRKLF